MELLKAIGMTLLVFIVFSAILEAMRRRGFDPVGSIARAISPDAPATETV